MIHTLTIPRWTPARINQWEGRHWSVKSRLKKADRTLIVAYAAQQGTPKAQGKRRVSLLLTLGKRMRAGDKDAYWKSSLDGCVCAGLLVDDSPKWCDPGTVTFARGEWSTSIILEDIE